MSGAFQFLAATDTVLKRLVPVSLDSSSWGSRLSASAAALMWGLSPSLEGASAAPRIVRVPYRFAGQRHRSAKIRPRLLGRGIGRRTAAGGDRACTGHPATDRLRDEPTGNLDTATGARVMDMLFARRDATGATLMIITHDAALAQRCDRIVEMVDGRIAA